MTIEETREVCSLCGGRGQEYCTSNTSGQMMCRNCQGSGQRLVKTVTTRTVVDDALVQDILLHIPQLLQRQASR